MGGVSSTTTVFILMLFVSIYVFSISTYSYISSLSFVDLWQRNRDELRLIRSKRNILDEPKDSGTENITFNLCCAESQWLNENLECVDGARGNSTQKLAGIMENLVVDKDMAHSFINVSRVNKKMNNTHFLSAADRFVVSWSPTKPSTYYISQEDGSLLELNQNPMEVQSKFSPSSFCLDQMNNIQKDFVAIVKPCWEKICIPKCCPKGSYFNAAKDKCVARTMNNIQSYQPTLFDKTAETKNNISYYIMYETPKCSSPDTLIKINEKYSPIYIQENGYLMTVESGDTFSFYKKYCVDVFSDGTANHTFINGFYCQNNSKPKETTTTTTTTTEIVKPQTEPLMEEVNKTLADAKDSVGSAIKKVGGFGQTFGQTVAKVQESGKKVGGIVSIKRSDAVKIAASASLGIFSVVICML